VPSRQATNAKIIVGYKNEDEFREKIRPFTTRVTADMFSDTETPMFMDVECPMSPDQARAYMQMKDLLLSQINGGMITAQNALVQLGKLSQIASGFIMDEDRQVTWLSQSKIDAAVTLLEDMAEPVIIWAPYIPLKAAMAEALNKMGVDWVQYTEPSDVDRWKEMENGVILGNQSSGLGVGQNLQKAAANIYLANTFSSEARWQSLKRTDRMGQTKQVRYWDLISPGTTDEKVKANLQAKADIASRNIDGLREILL